MAISPDEANKLTPEHVEVLKRQEERIDEYLRATFSGRPVSVDIGGCPGRVLTELVRRYEAAGWSVRVTSDQRDGDILELSPGTPGWGSVVTGRGSVVTDRTVVEKGTFISRDPEFVIGEKDVTDLR